MKKFIILIIISLWLFGCSSSDVSENLEMYNTAVNNFFGMVSYKMEVNENNTIYRLNDNDEVIGETAKSMSKKINIDKVNKTYYVFEGNDKTAYYTETWFVEDMVYLNNDGYKISYSDTKAVANMNVSFTPSLLNSDDVEKIKISKLDSKITLDFILSESGREKILAVNNYFGFGDNFNLENSNLEYKVVVINEYIYGFSLVGTFKGSSIDGRNSFYVDENVVIRDVNQTFVEGPNDISGFISSNAEYEDEFNVSDKDSFITYLNEIGYNESYELKINNNLSFKYNFENMTFSSINERVTYLYDYKNDIGRVNNCVYDFLIDEPIDSECSNKEYYGLLNAKNNFLRDINNVGADINWLIDSNE